MADGFSHGYALLIGVGGNLPETVNDAIRLYRTLTDPQRAGYPKTQVQALIGESASPTLPKADIPFSQPTRQGILEAFDALIARAKQDPDATVLVYYSGHGGVFQPAGSQAASYYLVPSDFDPNQRQATGISSLEFSKKIQAIQSKKLIVFLDCCHAAGLPRLKGEEAEPFTPDNQPADLLAELKAGSGKILVASCDKQEKSLTDNEQSIFTRVLLEALEGRAGGGDGNYAYLWGVLDYLSHQVSLRARRLMKKVQTVKIVDAADIDNIPLCRIAPGAAQAAAAKSVDAELYGALFGLGFNSQEEIFLEHHQKAVSNAFLINGSLDYGHYWLLRRMLQNLQDGSESPQIISFDMGYYGLPPEIAAIQQELFVNLTGGENLEMTFEAACSLLAEAIQTHHVALVFKSVQDMKLADKMIGLLEQFWYPLVSGVEQALQTRPQPRCRISLFLVYADDWTPFPVDLPSQADQLPSPACPLRLQLTNIDKSDLLTFLKIRQLDAHTRLPAEPKYNLMAEKILQKSFNGIPEMVAGQIFLLCKSMYKGNDLWLSVEIP